MRILLTFITLFHIFSISAQEVVFSENFSEGFFPEEWLIIDNDSNQVHPDVSEFEEAWILLQDPNDTNNYVMGSTSYFDPPDVASRWLVTPEIQLGDFGNYVSWFARSHDPSYPDSYKLFVSNSGVEIADFTEIATFSEETHIGTHRDIVIPDDYDNQSIRLAFVNITFNGFKLYLDSIEVREEDPLSVGELTTAKKMRVYPNPVKEKLFIQAGEGKRKHIKISDVLGKIVYDETTFSNKIRLEQLKRGVYFVEIQFEQENFRTKIVKE